jgi:hypothetical protein
MMPKWNFLAGGLLGSGVLLVRGIWEPALELFAEKGPDLILIRKMFALPAPGSKTGSLWHRDARKCLPAWESQ